MFICIDWYRIIFKTTGIITIQTAGHSKAFILVLPCVLFKCIVAVVLLTVASWSINIVCHVTCNNYVGFTRTILRGVLFRETLDVGSVKCMINVGLRNS